MIPSTFIFLYLTSICRYFSRLINAVAGTAGQLYNHALTHALSQSQYPSVVRMQSFNVEIQFSVSS